MSAFVHAAVKPRARKLAVHFHPPEMADFFTGTTDLAGEVITRSTVLFDVERFDDHRRQTTIGVKRPSA